MRLALLALFLVVACSAGAENAPAPKLSPNSTSDQVLDALKAVGQDLKDFTTTVKMTTDDPYGGDQTSASGIVKYQAKGKDDGRLLVVFDTKKIGDQVDKNAKSVWLLDNGWLIERDYKRKLQVDRQVLKPGEKMNMLKLGEGPFPLPIGQDRAEVLKQFDVKKIDAKPDDPPGTVHIQLIPKPQTRFARKFNTIDVWVQSSTSFPQRITMDDKGQKVIRTTDLGNVRVNAGIGEKDFALEKVDGWIHKSESLED